MSDPAIVFLDASVMVAASRSPTGGSSVALEACSGRLYRAVMTRLVLQETMVNVTTKFGEAELLRLYELLALANLDIVPPPTSASLDLCEPLTGPKDAHVLAAALDCGARYLLTLDRRHLLNCRVLTAGLPVEAMTPGDFLEGIVRART